MGGWGDESGWVGGWVGGLSYLVVEGEAVVGVLNQLVDGEGGVVGLHHRVGDLGGEGGWVGGWVGD